MNTIKINSFAKINLSLDVGRVQPNGMHPVDMIMQQISLHDVVSISISKSLEDSAKALPQFLEQTSERTAESSDVFLNEVSIVLTCSNPDLPTDGRNLAYRAAELMLNKYAEAMLQTKVAS